jgi:frataxin-like iron-binding protein CyaY
MTRLRRITMDWDFKNPLKVLFYLNRVLKFVVGKDSKIVIKKSHSKGYHIFLWTRANGSKFKIKDYCGNDKHQTRLDQRHKYARQTMFSKKKKIRRVKL